MVQSNRMETAQKIHEAYMQCKEIFDPGKILMNVAVNINDEEEDLFFRTVSDFFIQQRQKEVINR